MICRARLRNKLLAAAVCVVVAGGVSVTYAYASPSQTQSLNELRTQEIQLRNAMEKAPGDGSIRIELAKVYLRLGNSNAAVAELIVARQLHVKDEIVAPLMAQAMTETGDFENMLRDVPEGNRPPKVESIVRTYRAVAQMGIGEDDNARTSLADAERLDPTNIVAKVASARLLLVSKQFPAAEQKVNQALAMAPNNVAALEIKGLLLEFRNDLPGALGLFNKALSIDPRNIQILLDRANIEANRNQLDQAERDIAAINAIAPNVAMVSYVDAVVKAKRGKYQEADTALDKLRPLMENFPEAYLLAGQIKFKLNQSAQAESYLTKFIAHNQSEPQAYELLGVLALQRGDSERAIDMLQKARDLAPQDANVSVILAQAFLAHGEVDKAAQLMDEAKARQPNNANVLSERALVHFAFGDPGASVTELEALFKGGKGDLKVGPSLVLSFLREGKVSDAVKTAQIMSEREPGNVLYQELLGAAFVAQRNFTGAEGIFQKVLARQPELVSARRSLAQIYLQTGQPEKAAQILQDWINAHPADLKAKTALAGILVEQKDFAAAVKLLTDANILTAGSSNDGLQLVEIYEIQHDWPDAVSAAKTLLGRFPDDQSVMDALGRCYAESGDLNSSAAVYAKATAAFPQSAFLWNNYATALSRAKNFQGALDAISKAHALVPGNLVYQRGLVAMTYQVKGQAAALAVGQTFSGNTAQNPIAAIFTADAMAKAGKLSDAIALLEATQSKTPSSDCAVLLAKYYEAENLPSKAITVLEAWTSKHPDDVDARFGLAQLYGSSANYPKALAEFEWLATQRPNDAVVANNLAWLYSQKGDARARASAEKAYSLAPRSGSIADTLGWILENQGDTAGALKYLKIADSETPDDPNVQYHLAYALTKANQPAAARPILRKLLDSSATGADVKTQAKQLLDKIGS